MLGSDAPKSHPAEFSDVSGAIESPSTFSRAEKLVIAACAISVLIVQMDWFALLALHSPGPRAFTGYLVSSR